MPVYVVRLNDGSCLIGEADSESQAGEDFVSRWEEEGFDPELILSVREMPRCTFLSRWWPTEYLATGGIASELEGNINDDNDIYEKEYPIIDAVHKKAVEEMAGFSEDTAIDDWNSKLEQRLKEAVKAEMRRGNPETELIQ